MARRVASDARTVERTGRPSALIDARCTRCTGRRRWRDTRPFSRRFVRRMQRPGSTPPADARALGYTPARYPVCIVRYAVEPSSDPEVHLVVAPRSRIAGDRPVPHIVTELPGPKARAHVAFDETWTSPSLPRAYPIVPVRGEGLTIEDIDGNLFLDFAAGIAVNSTGHAHPQVVAAIKEQAAELIHFSASDFYLPIYPEVCRGSPRSHRSPARARAYLGNSGAEVVEAAIKLARFATKRPYIVAFLGAFHGRTYGASQPHRLEGQVPRRVRAAAAGRLPRAVRPGRGPALVRRGPVRQARPGRTRSRRSSSSRSRARAATSSLRTASSRACARSATARDPAHRRRDPVGRRADRQDVGRRALGRQARHPAHREGHRQRACRSARWSPARTCSRPGAQAPTARPTAN